MDVARWQKLEEVFNATLALPAEQRTAYLSAVCDDDLSLRDEIEALLSEVDQPDRFLSESTFTLGTQLLSDESFESLAGKTLGTYAIVRRIGRGGMGEVYLARDERLGRKVAIKLLPKRLIEDAERIRRFKHEARAASAISHPNVAHIYEIGEADGRFFIAMELVDGVTLRERLSKQNLVLREALDIATQVASAIAAAHAEGIVHRDIKPENVMIRPDGLVKVVDFGLAKLSEPLRESAKGESWETRTGARITGTIHTEPGLLLGTATYMSPEQARGQETDARTDIWSWGIVFYEMLGGEPPFRGATSSDVIAEILKSEPSLSRAAFLNLPQSAMTIVGRALSKDRNDRYAEMSEPLADLRELRREVSENGLQFAALPLNESLASSAGDSARVTAHGGPVPEAGSGLARAATVTATSLSRNAKDDSTSTSKSSAYLTTRNVLISSVLMLAAVTLGIILLTRFNLIFHKAAATASRSLEIIHLTNDGYVMDAAISPDARLLAYVPIEAGKQSLRVRNLESNESWELLPPDPALCWGMRFALNNESLFYVSKQPGSTVSVLYRIPVRGGPSQKLVTNIDSPPGLSPDGMQIAFVRSYPGQHRDALIVANVDGSAEREILSRMHPDRLALAGVTWSPDGKTIATGATRHDETEAAVLGVPVGGGAAVELTAWKWSTIRGVVWKNDGRTILLSAQLPGSNALQIWRVAYPEQTVEPLTNDQNEYEEATLAPNVLVATHTYEVADLWSCAPPNTFQRLTSDGHNGADGMAVTPGGRVIYTVGEYAASQLWSMTTNNGDRRLLSRNGVHPSAAKVGETIAYVSSEGGAHHIWLVNSDGGDNHQLTVGEGENYPGMSPDGQWIFYVARAQNRGTLWKIPAVGGKSVQLTFAGIITNPVISPDGKQIACTFRADEGDKWKIAILSAEGGEPLHTFAVPSPFYQIIRWTSDSKAFTYLVKENGAQNIWRQPIDGSGPVKLTDFKEDSILHYDWSASGQQFILSRGGRRRDIVLMKNID